MKKSKNHYETLGVPLSANASDLKKAYRKKARQIHPDHAGAQTTGQFQELQRAYSILKDPNKRAQYDQFGDSADTPHTMREQAETHVAQFIVECITRHDPETTDVLGKVRENIQRQLQGFKQAVEAVNNEIAKFKTASKRLRRKDGQQGLVVRMLEEVAEKREKQIKESQFEIAKGKEMLLVLDEYEYKFKSASIHKDVMGPTMKWGQTVYGGPGSVEINMEGLLGMFQTR